MAIDPSISKRALAAFGPGAKGRDAKVLDSSIHWVEAGEGKPIVFFHGNPTSSFLWRKVFSRWSGQGRLLAVDLIGFGESGKPDIEYTLADHQRYVDAWLDSLDLHDVTFVLHDYGATFGLSWARRHPERVRAVALLEPIIRPIPSHQVARAFIELRAQVLQPGVGERIILEENKWITGLLPGNVLAGLTDEEKQVYAAPFPTARSRKPILVFPRALPVDGKPDATIALLDQNAEWLASSNVPKILLTFEPGFLLPPDVLDWSRNTIRNLKIQALGAGNHYVPEDQPEAIAQAIQGWLQGIER